MTDETLDTCTSCGGQEIEYNLDCPSIMRCKDCGLIFTTDAVLLPEPVNAELANPAAPVTICGDCDHADADDPGQAAACANCDRR